MKKNEKKSLLIGSIFLAMFAVWTVLILTVDVQPLGQNGTGIGFATFNCWFHHFTGVNMVFYKITDWMGLVLVAICLSFAGMGLVQLIKRRSLFRVDADIGVLPVNRTIKNNKFLYRQPNYGWRYFYATFIY